MQYLQIMDRGALSLVFSPVDSSAALGVEGVSEQESGSSKRISRRLSRRGSETKSEEVRHLLRSHVVLQGGIARQTDLHTVIDTVELQVICAHMNWAGGCEPWVRIKQK